MRSHQKHGFSHSDVSDYALRNCNKGFGRALASGECVVKTNGSRRRPIFTSLNAAHDHTTHAMHYARKGEAGMPGYYTYEDHVRFARDYIAKAREWRLELQG